MIPVVNRIDLFDRDTRERTFSFDVVNRIEIETSRDTYTDIATIYIPNKLYRSNVDIINRIRVGDKIEVWIGYGEKLLLEFSGFIKRVTPSSPLVLFCEDIAWQYKRFSINDNITLVNTSLSKLVNEYISSLSIDNEFLSNEMKNIRINLTDADIGDWVVTKGATLIDILDEIKSKLGLLAYFQNGELYLNYEIEKSSDRGIRLVLDGALSNVPIDGDNIEIDQDTNLNVVSHGVTVDSKGNETIELFAYYKDNEIGSDIIVTKDKPTGVLNTLKIPDITEDRLRELIIRRLPNLWYNRGVGSVTTFGFPSVKHGDIARVESIKHPEKNGLYKIVSIVKILSIDGGYKQNIMLSNRFKK